MFHWVYVVWMEPLFSYLGVSYETSTPFRIIVTYSCIVLPVLWIPDEIKRPSQFMYWITYVLTYIPMIFIPLFTGYSDVDFLVYTLTLFSGLLLLGASYIFPLKKLEIPPFSNTIFWFTFLSIVGIFILLIVYYLGGSLKLVNIFDSTQIYEQRLRDDVDRGPVAYPMNLLAGVFAPFLFAYGLAYKNKKLLVASFAVQLLIFSVGANKGFILNSGAMLGVFFLFRNSLKNVGTKILLSLSFPLFIIGFVYQFMRDDVTSEFFAFSSLIVFRTIGISTYNMPFYVDFFKDHPYTYYTHINIINKLTGAYPYKRPMGRVLGNYFHDNPEFNMNANFWLTDGIASIGLIGIPIISLVGALVFYIFDCSGIRHSKLFVIILSAYAALVLQNVSLFTTVITGGLGFLMILLLLKK